MSHTMKPQILIVLISLLFVFSAKAENKVFDFNNTPDNVLLLTLKQDTIRLNLNKKFTIISFFSIYCKPCLVELNAFQENYKKWNESFDVDIMAITSSSDFKYFDKIIKFAERKQYSFPLYLDINNSFTKYSYFATVSEKEKYFRESNGIIEIIRPQIFIFDSNGKLIFHKRAFLEGDEEKIFEFLKQYEE